MKLENTELYLFLNAKARSSLSDLRIAKHQKMTFIQHIQKLNFISQDIQK